MEIEFARKETRSQGKVTITYSCKVYEGGSLLATFPTSAANELEAASLAMRAMSRMYEAFIEGD